MSRLSNKYHDKKISKKIFESRITSYRGWIKFCNSKNLANKIERYTKYRLSTWRGDLKLISKFNRKKIFIIEYIAHNKYFEVHFIRNHKPISIQSKDRRLYSKLYKLNLPCNFKYECSKFHKKTKCYRVVR